MQRNRWLVWLIIILLLIVAVVAGYFLLQGQKAVSVPAKGSEQPVQLIQLAGEIASPSAELSGLAWHGDTLIFLPQYPERFGSGDGAFFALPKADILNYLDGKSTAPLSPLKIKLTATGLKESIKDYQGYEAIGFHGDQVFVTIEAGQGTDMHGYLVSGLIAGDEIKLDASRKVEIRLPIQSDNHADEALIVTTDRVLTFFEINGANLNSQPAAQAFNFDLTPQPSIAFPHLEYRVTDAALSDGKIWVVNYFFPGDTAMLPKVDPLAQEYGEGQTHSQYDQVERLVELDYSNSGIKLANTAPIQMSLEKDARNWEGLALLDQRGFLVVTDKFPSTLFGLVPLP